MRYLALLLLCLVTVAAGRAETGSVNVKYRGLVDLAPFTCRENPEPSFVKRTCFDAKEQYMLILLDRTWYHYCDMSPAIYRSLTNETHMGRYYADHIKGKGGDGPFDCRTHRVPAYDPRGPNCTQAFERDWAKRANLPALPKPQTPCVMQGDHDRYLCKDEGCAALP